MSTLPRDVEPLLAHGTRVYTGKARAQLGFGLLFILFSLAGLIEIHPLLLWYHGGPVPAPKAFLTLSCLLLFPLGLVGIANAIRGLPRLTVGPEGVALQLAFSTTWASWDSIDPFAIKTTAGGRFGRQVKTAAAKITGPNANQKQFKLITISNHFAQPIEEIVADINAARASSLGIAHADGNAAPAAEMPVGLSGFVVPWLTLGLLAVLIGVFVLENSFPVTTAVKGAPSLQTLFAMGALSHAAILSGDEWYRLFTAPLLHLNFAHLAGNGVALLLGGWLFERLVGRLWFFAFFSVGALGGSLASLAIQPANLISVGASGALMGLFAGLFVSSFRIGSGNSARTRLQISSMRVLIPSLLPFLSRATDIHVDFAAHFGGALVGAALALVLLRLWPETAAIPQARRAAAIVAALGLVLFIGSAGIAIGKYPDYKVALSVPPKSAPANPPPRVNTPADTAIDGRAAYLRGNNTTGTQSHGSLVPCSGTFFPNGRGAVPGINCSN